MVIDIAIICTFFPLMQKALILLTELSSFMSEVVLVFSRETPHDAAVHGSNGHAWAPPGVTETRWNSSRLDMQLRSIKFIKETPGKMKSYREP